MTERKTATISPGHSRALQAIVVHAVDGPGKGARAVLRSGTLSVGSEKGCDLLLSDETVSRRHLIIELHPGEVLVRDLNSRNGTQYLGARISTARVPLGGSILVGKTTLQLRPETSELPFSERQELGGLIGASGAMRRLFTQIERLAAVDSTVLLEGETGVGKGAVARALHGLSPRAERPLAVFDCGAVAPTLIETALFGQVKGAYTGADRDRPGAVAAAEGGTLLLDEVGELPPDLQPKLLRLLEEREYRPVGSAQPRRADIRVIAATNRRLMAEVTAGRFRRDLYYRLAVAELEVPPLRNRPEDIPLLAVHFAKEIAGFEVAFEPATVAAFQCSSWPGNVRELRNAVERVLTLGSLPEPSVALADASFISARDEALRRFEHDYLVSLLAKHKGEVVAAAKSAKLARSHFYRLLTRNGLVGNKE